MKIKGSFITNSSSTSFVLINKVKLTAEEFIDKLWDNGLGDLIKRRLIDDLNMDKIFPKNPGVNELFAHSDECDLFNTIFYELVNNIELETDNFIIKSGSPDVFYDDRKHQDDEGFKNSFPEEYQDMIEQYIKDYEEK